MDLNWKVLFAESACGRGFLDGLEQELDPEDVYDFEVDFDNENERYYVSVETFLAFQTKEDVKEYLTTYLNEFEKWMIKHNYDTSYEPNLYEIFTEGININTDFKTIEACFGTFRYLVRNFEGESIFKYGTNAN